MLDTITHKWLRIPYTLNVRYIRKVDDARSTLLFIHGLGDTGDVWQSVIQQLPDDVTIIVVDLLGFGKSPRPAWSKYNVKAQAHSLLSTYLSLRIRSQVIVVGHSLGSLVAVDFAKRYPLLTQSLVLCSPPIYKQTKKLKLYKSPDDMLRALFMRVASDPERLIQLYALGRRVGVANESLAVNDENIKTFIATLHASVINQNTIRDIPRLHIPIHIVHGLFDPFVVRTNLTGLSKNYLNVKLHEVPAGHIIVGPYVKKIVSIIDELVKQ